MPFLVNISLAALILVVAFFIGSLAFTLFKNATNKDKK